MDTEGSEGAGGGSDGCPEETDSPDSAAVGSAWAGDDSDLSDEESDADVGDSGVAFRLDS